MNLKNYIIVLGLFAVLMCCISTITAAPIDTMDNITSEMDKTDSVSLNNVDSVIDVDESGCASVLRNNAAGLLQQSPDTISLNSNGTDEEYIPGNDSQSNDTDSNSNNSDSVSIKSEDFVAYYKIKPVYKVQLVNSTGMGVTGKTVEFKINGKTYNNITDKDGFASLKIDLKSGKYDINIRYENTSSKQTVTLFKSRVSSASNLKSVYGKAVRYNLKVVDNYGNLMNKALVIFKVDKKVYRKYTNANGIASLKLNSNSGKHVIRYEVNGITGKNSYVVKNKITLKIYKWGIKGDHIKIPLIRKNMPNNYWVKKVVAATKKGLPLLTIKGGKGKKVFITAGVHGNEIPPQVAVMKLIAYLSSKPIKGTVYIIPFVNIKAAYHQVRLTNYDFNRVANVQGTVSNKIVNLIVKLKCDAYGDFHSTVSPGDPGLNIILGFKNSKSTKLTNYLAKSCNVHKRFHYAGGIHKWTLADWATYKGVPTVLCEVISKVSSVSKFNSGLSYKMMNKFLKYNSII